MFCIFKLNKLIYKINLRFIVYVLYNMETFRNNFLNFKDEKSCAIKEDISPKRRE